MLVFSGRFGMRRLQLGILIGFCLLSVAPSLQAEDNEVRIGTFSPTNDALRLVYGRYTNELQAVPYITFSNRFDEVQQGKRRAFEFFADKAIAEVVIYALENRNASVQRIAVLSSARFLEKWPVHALVAAAKASDSWSFQRGEEVVVAERTREKAVEILKKKTGIEASFDVSDDALVGKFLNDCLKVKSRIETRLPGSNLPEGVQERAESGREK